MDKEQYKLLLQIAQLYYEENKTQSEIAKLINVHRSSVSRMLKHIRELGIVSIAINRDLLTDTSLEQKLKQKFNLRDIIVVPVNYELDNNSKNNIVAEVAAKKIINYIKPNSYIGVSWGRTLCSFIENFQLKSNQYHNTHVIPLIGGPSGKFEAKYHVNTIAHAFANKLGGKASLIDYPAIVDTNSMAKEIYATKHIQAFLKAWQKLDVAIYALGSPAVAKHMIWHGFYGDLIKDLIDSDIVGDVLSRFYNKQGIFVDYSLTERIIGIDLELFKKIPTKICIVGDLDKLHAIEGALQNGQLIDVLVVSDEIAEKIMR